MRVRGLVATILLLVASGFAIVGAQSEQAVGVSLGLDQEFYYAGHRLELRVSVKNTGTTEQENPLQSPLLRGFKVRPRGGEPLTAVADSGVPEPDRPKKIAPGAFYGTVLDLTRLYPQLRQPGTFEIYWGADTLISNMLVVTIIERYDPKADYWADIETAQGTIVVDLYENSSPLAAQAFVDMARTGVYDGMTIHEARRDAFIVGGDPQMVPGPPRRTVEFPTELPPLPVVAGSFLLKPVSAAPLANSSVFMITLRPQADLNGQVTVLGQVTKGLDVVRTLSQVPTTVRNSQPNFKPLENIFIRKVTIREHKTANEPPPA